MVGWFVIMYRSIAASLGLLEVQILPNIGFGSMGQSDALQNRHRQAFSRCTK